MNAVADLQAAIITFADTVLRLGIVAVVVGSLAILVYLIARNAIGPS